VAEHLPSKQEALSSTNPNIARTHTHFSILNWKNIKSCYSGVLLLAIKWSFFYIFNVSLSLTLSFKFISICKCIQLSTCNRLPPPLPFPASAPPLLTLLSEPNFLKVLFVYMLVTSQLPPSYFPTTLRLPWITSDFLVTKVTGHIF
jgi:hypothetical protein